MNARRSAAVRSLAWSMRSATNSIGPCSAAFRARSSSSFDLESEAVTSFTFFRKSSTDMRVPSSLTGSIEFVTRSRTEKFSSPENTEARRATPFNASPLSALCVVAKPSPPSTRSAKPRNG